VSVGIYRWFKETTVKKPNFSKRKQFEEEQRQTHGTNISAADDIHVAGRGKEATGSKNAVREKVRLKTLSQD
jgi:hypothetical protein